jgi:hypothetical protein
MMSVPLGWRLREGAAGGFPVDRGGWRRLWGAAALSARRGAAVFGPLAGLLRAAVFGPAAALRAALPFDVAPAFAAAFCAAGAAAALAGSAAAAAGAGVGAAVAGAAADGAGAAGRFPLRRWGRVRGSEPRTSEGRSLLINRHDRARRPNMRRGLRGADRHAGPIAPPGRSPLAHPPGVARAPNPGRRSLRTLASATPRKYLGET